MLQPPRRHAFKLGLWPIALLAAAFATVACEGPTEIRIDPWVPGRTQLSMVSGDNQSGTVGQPLAAPFVVRVVDEQGKPVSGAVVLWDVVEGDGDFPAAPKGPRKLFHETKTDAQGIGSLVLTLGPRSGQNVVECRVMFGSGSATFVARGSAAAAGR